MWNEEGRLWSTAPDMHIPDTSVYLRAFYYEFTCHDALQLSTPRADEEQRLLLGTRRGNVNLPFNVGASSVFIITADFKGGNCGYSVRSADAVNQ